MGKRWRKLGWFGPSKRQLRKAQARVDDVVKTIRENRLRDADPADTAKAEAIADVLFENPDRRDG